LSVPALNTSVEHIFSHSCILCDQVGPGCQINILVAGISEMQQHILFNDATWSCTS